MPNLHNHARIVQMFFPRSNQSSANALIDNESDEAQRFLHTAPLTEAQIFCIIYLRFYGP